MSDYAVIDPSTGERVEEFEVISEQDLASAIGSAHEAYTTWSRTTTAEQRAALIRRVAELHVERKDELAEIIVREMGKPLAQAVGEVEFAADIYAYYADNGPGFLADEPIQVD
ncbi:aldehyde dehydrogenase family protein, partial [Herbiconiux sp. SYSU D00978]|uniref:aldehyde dehydrogenase family protein n=1 Tax=Herbiconiux sp. SYSU D00978 TaxID=2812562 RepID=UPI001A97C545